MKELAGKVVWVSGASSMVGSAVCSSLRERQAIVLSPTHNELELSDEEQVNLYFLRHQFQYICHCAGFNGNISFNAKYPAIIFERTTRMAINVLKLSRYPIIKKIVSVLPSCAYPSGNSDAPLKETDLWNGLPDESVECHGLAKRVLDAYGRQLHKQYGTICKCVVLNNCYGPGDSLDINKTKVVGGLIVKFLNAVKNNDHEVVCWGTGEPRRELLYSEDAGEGIVFALQHCDDVFHPTNIGGTEVTIKELAEKIASLCGFTGKITWDTTRPNGQMRKLLDSQSIKKLGFEQKFSLDEGLLRTVEWCKWATGYDL